jgi:hypothetical protein
MIILKAALSVGAFEYHACRLAASYNDSMLAKLVGENNLGLISDQGYDDCFVREVSKRLVIPIEEHFDRNKIVEELRFRVLIIIADIF